MIHPNRHSIEMDGFDKTIFYFKCNISSILFRWIFPELSRMYAEIINVKIEILFFRINPLRPCSRCKNKNQKPWTFHWNDRSARKSNACACVPCTRIKAVMKRKKNTICTLHTSYLFARNSTCRQIPAPFICVRARDRFLYRT